MEQMVGFRFCPTEEEVIEYYLMNRILGEIGLVEQAINEVDIYKFDPWDLPAKSRIVSSDHVWYFFYSMENKKKQNRTTPSGSWRLSGKTIDIKRTTGNPQKIGEKKIFAFDKGKSVYGSLWVMHEYHTASFTPHQRSHVVCRVEFKGRDLNNPLGDGCEPSQAIRSEVNQPVNDDPGSLDWQQQVETSVRRVFDDMTRDDLDFLLGDAETVGEASISDSSDNEA